MIRCYRVTDRAEVEAIIGSGLRDLETLARLLNPPEDEGYFKEEYEELCAGLNDDPRSWWIEVSKEGVIQGCAWIRALKDSIGPYHTTRFISVSAPSRGKGVATSLLNHAECLATETDSVMLLISGFRNNRALELYRRQGYTDFPDRFREDKNPNNSVLWKPLAEKLLGEQDARQDGSAGRVTRTGEARDYP